MRNLLCSFSGLKVPPGKGRQMIRTENSKIMYFMSHKSERAYLLEKNPRDVRWTALYRKKNKKGIQQDEKKKKGGRKTTKVEKAYAGLTLQDMKQKRNQTTAFREQQRIQAIKETKERQRKKQAEKAAAKKSEAAKRAEHAKKDGVKQQQKQQFGGKKPAQKSRPTIGNLR